MTGSQWRTQGLTLIEVLITSTLVVVLLGLVSQFFVLQSRSSSLQKAQNEANEGTRTALSLVAWDLQNAGYRVTISTASPAIVMTNSTHRDTITTRFLNEDVNPSVTQKVLYDIAQGTGETVTSLRRAQFADTLINPPNGLQASIASIVALNIRFETRLNQFVTPTGTACPSGSTPLPVGATGASIKNCSVNWVWADVPQRLVRRIRVQVLGRSEIRVPRYNANRTFVFEGGSQYTSEPGFVYHFAEQTVLAPNLGR